VRLRSLVRHRVRMGIVIALVAVVYVTPRVNLLRIPLDRDEGVFGYAGQRILEGGKPYVDVLDHKPPGAFYIYALALTAFPPSGSGVHSFLHLYNCLTLVVVTLAIRARFVEPWAWIAGALAFAIFSASPAIQGFSASAEMLMLPPIVLSLLFAVRGQRSGRAWMVRLSGAFAAVACFIKPTALASVTFTAACAAGWFIAPEANSDPLRNTTFRSLLNWIAGAAFVAAVVLGYFASIGAFGEFLYWSFAHNAEYALRSPITETTHSMLRGLLDILRGDFPVVLTALGACVWLNKRRIDSAFVLTFMALSLIGALPGYAYPHYFAQLAPAVAIAAGWTVGVCADSTLRWRSYVAAGVLTLMVALPMYFHRATYFQLSPEEISRRYFGENPFPEAQAISTFLAKRTDSHDLIFIAGSEPEILFEAKRRSATPMVMLYPLTQEYRRYKAFQERFSAEVLRGHPAYILTTNIAMSIGWDGRASLEILNSLSEQLLPDYELEAVAPVRDSSSRVILVEHGIPQSQFSMDEPSILIYRRLKH
jgi:hypothetical protein